MVQKRLSEAAGVPIKLRVTIVPATLTEVGGTSKEGRGGEPVVPSVEVDGPSEPVGEEVIEADPSEPTGN